MIKNVNFVDFSQNKYLLIQSGSVLPNIIYVKIHYYSKCHLFQINIIYILVMNYL